ncbi:MAG: tRNA (N6-threonylcarbamoyladenosine(37)-N6)-methyltransferase TrmO [Clostridia bacterium]|nr:tRNA (N6-threonylcarbamoyladenosine(37)-N6)-methyltransferase TrmO [Clostridia bacterium]
MKKLKIIANISTEFPEKFGVPRQSGLIPELKAKIVFTPEYRKDEALKGLSGFSHIWILWGFSKNEEKDWSPTVRPPRLGGNKRVGVFATRSPFRPNPIGLSVLKLENILKTDEFGTVLEVSGADMVDGTPIYDIKPYIPYTDSVTDAKGGFSDEVYGDLLEVNIPTEIEQTINSETLVKLKKILASDPRPSYHNDPDRVYSFEFETFNIKFKVNKKTLHLISVTHI